jgi:hypothetical protein
MNEPLEEYTNEEDYQKGININSDFYEEDIYGNADGDAYFEESDIIDDIDFSEFKGKDFKSKLRKVNKVVAKKVAKKNKPLDKDFIVKKKAVLYGKSYGGGTEKTTKRIIVPSTQKVIVEGVDKFIMGDDDKCDTLKNIGYYNCKKLKELIITINNDSDNEFLVSLFDPSQPLDYLYATSGNLNNKVQIAGGIVQYSDVLFNILGNPIHIPNAKLTFAGPTASILQQQINQPFIFTNKSATGTQVVEPLQLQLQVDTMQVANDIVFFDLSQLGRPFIPDGMDVIKYKVLPGCTVTFAFFYRQREIKRFFFKEARTNKKLI